MLLQQVDVKNVKIKPYVRLVYPAYWHDTKVHHVKTTSYFLYVEIFLGREV